MRKARAECPRCHSARIAPVMDGPITVDTVEVVQAAVYHDAIILAGTRLGDDTPGWACRACGHAWTVVRASAPAA